MLLKWLLTGLIVYGVYRFLIKPQMLNQQQSPKAEQHDDEYVDYEEVKD